MWAVDLKHTVNNKWSYGICGPTLLWLVNFLSDRTQQVASSYWMGATVSDILPVTPRVPQRTYWHHCFLCVI